MFSPKILGILLSVIVANNGINGELSTPEAVVDTLVVEIFRIGDSENLLHEDVGLMKRVCQLFSNRKFVYENRDILTKIFDGLGGVAIARASTTLVDAERDFCVLIDKGLDEDAIKLSKNTNKYNPEAEKWRFGLMKYLDDAFKPDTKTNFPEYLCMVKQFKEKFYGTYPEADGVRHNVISIVEPIVSSYYNIIAEANIKPSENCVLTPLSTQVSDNKSFMLMMAKAIFNLDKKTKRVD